MLGVPSAKNTGRRLGATPPLLAPFVDRPHLLQAAETGPRDRLDIFGCPRLCALFMIEDIS